MKDVATMAGVSQATVSYVLSGREGVRISDATRQRVKRIATELQYRPHAIARGLARGNTQTIGVYAHTEEAVLSGLWRTEVMRGVAEELLAHNYHLLLYGYRTSAPEPPVSLFLDGRVDGLIFLSPHMGDTLPSELEMVRMPTVFVGTHEFQSSRVSCVDSDSIGGAIQAIEHLIQLGHRRIAHLCGPSIAPNARDRVAGYRLAMEKNGLPILPELLISAGFSEEEGYQATRILLSKGVAVTAIFAANDVCAIGAMRACHEFGVRVPEDMSVIGFDDVPFCEITHPKLTTIHQSSTVLGQQAVRWLLQIISSGAAAPSAVIMPTELIVRESTARAPAFSSDISS
ncbi:MAG: LacI family transcriptional regulator [Armatimonadetes bacterium]|nr:LacI family transcriptional regulator [Armatimonadota bacterium]